ncbi:MAG: hypothetical protein HY235_29660 [Acidobacteria bacterium]|nr:hypothetical protein [Acidobacteriota bacterium]
MQGNTGSLCPHWMPALLWLSVAAVVPAAAQPDSFTTIDYPGATQTIVRKINDSGDIAGGFRDANNVLHGFLLSGGKFTEINYPGASATIVNGINNRGDMVGTYSGTAGLAFLLRQGEFTPLTCPDSDSFQANAINSSGDVAGWINVAGVPAKGLVWNRGVCTLSEYRPENPRRTMTMYWGYWGLNNAGVTVEHYGMTVFEVRGRKELDAS